MLDFSLRETGAFNPGLCNMWQLAAVGAGGCVGAIARYAINGWTDRQFPGFLPAGTLIANVLGCLLIGVVMVLVHDRKWLSPEAQSLIVTGFLGSLTTFSTFGYQTVELLEEQRLRAGLLNLFANLIACFAAVAFAMWLTRRLLGT